MRTVSTPRITFLALALAAVGISPCAAQNTAITDPKDAGIDYEIQGEYRGRVETEDRDEHWGVQIIALGNGKFDLVGYIGGLPGEGWNRGGDVLRYSGELKDGNKAVFEAEDTIVEIADGKLKVIAQGNNVSTLEKVERKSSTLGKAAPEGAIVLFDGTSVDHWENGRLVDGRYLGATNPVTKQQFGDHSLHIEFRTPLMPAARGQARGNSGVYLQGRYELQVLDSFGLEGKNNECGGIYTIAEPIVNMCLPPLAWQTYDIDFTAAVYESDKKTKNARVTIKHNGVVIHDNLELPNGTPGFRPEGPGKESLFLQDHGNPVVFRNIWIVEK